MKKKIADFSLFLCYFLFILSLVLLYGTSQTDDKGNISYLSACLSFFSIMLILLVLSLLINIILRLVSYFRKPKSITEEPKQIVTDKGPIDSFTETTKEYLPNFLSSYRQNKKTINVLAFHSLFIPLYSAIIYFQKTIEYRLFYFYFIFLLGMLCLLVFLVTLFLPPLKYREKGEKEILLYQDHLFQRIGEKENILYISQFTYQKETKRYFVFLTRDNQSIILKKEKMKEESIRFLSELCHSKKERNK